MRQVDEATVQYFRANAGKAVERMKRIRREDCPQCDGVASRAELQKPILRRTEWMHKDARDT
jgi:hypothetical protein